MDYFTNYLEEELPLTDANEFTKEAENDFDQFSVNKKYLIILASKIPVMNYFPSLPPTSEITPLDHHGEPNNFSFTIDGTHFTIPKDHYNSTVEFNVQVDKESNYPEDEFWKEFIDPFIADCEDEQIDIEAVLDQFVYKIRSLCTCQYQSEEIGSEREVEYQFIRAIRDSLHFISLHKLELNSQIDMNQTMEYLKAKGASVTGNNNPHPKLDPIFGNQRRLKFLGIDTVPNFTSGFETKILCSGYVVNVVIDAAACGELKRPDCGISSAYQSLVSDESNWDNTCPLTPDSTNPTAPERTLRKFNETLIKICTIAVNSGSDRFFISDYKHIIFFKIDLPFTLAPTGNYRGHTQHIIKLKHFCIDTANQKYSRLMLLAFLSSRPNGNDLACYRKSILTYLKETRTSRVQSNPGPKYTSVPSSTGSGTATTSVQLDLDGDLEVPSNSTDFMKRSLIYDMDLFREPYFISLKHLDFKFMRCGENFHSQVFSLPKPDQFLSHLNFLNKFDSPYTDGKLVLKIYDWTWFHQRPRLSFLAASNEAKAYYNLQNSNVAPNLLAYGLMIDNSIAVGEIHPRSSGPFLLLEHVERQPIEKHQVTEEMLKEQVVPVLKKIHDHGVVHQDLKFENIVFGVDGVKIIDFGSSEISYDENLQKHDILTLYHDFGFRYES